MYVEKVANRGANHQTETQNIKVFLPIPPKIARQTFHGRHPNNPTGSSTFNVSIQKLHFSVGGMFIRYCRGMVAIIYCSCNFTNVQFMA